LRLDTDDESFCIRGLEHIRIETLTRKENSNTERITGCSFQWGWWCRYGNI